MLETEQVSLENRLMFGRFLKPRLLTEEYMSLDFRTWEKVNFLTEEIEMANLGHLWTVGELNKGSRTFSPKNMAAFTLTFVAGMVVAAGVANFSDESIDFIRRLFFLSQPTIDSGLPFNLISLLQKRVF